MLCLLYVNTTTYTNSYQCVYTMLYIQYIESLDYLHRSGYCHNTISSECIWLSSTLQQVRLSLLTLPPYITAYMPTIHAPPHVQHHSLIYHIISYYSQSSTLQQDIETLSVMLSELGSCEKFSDLGPYAKQGVNKDLYNLGMYI